MGDRVDQDFAGSFEGGSLGEEYGELLSALALWSAERLLEGHRPVPLQFALKTMADIASGARVDGGKFYEAVKARRDLGQ
ncbi:hypothetical protein G3T14_15755 [Methylobacterium sp. BTF04]|uniref:hypothetical protein n=1 Tax=Methylobacterium sp. BTF04 TaxID=2708300 RepID=UPI0013D2CBB9|nr:hypothetical protein [Methylobacterium sp. BTF04]NEU13574.1 hypothetical protein [Methylobacterium sp. BTF04]